MPSCRGELGVRPDIIEIGLALRNHGCLSIRPGNLKVEVRSASPAVDTSEGDRLVEVFGTQHFLGRRQTGAYNLSISNLIGPISLSYVDTKNASLRANDADRTPW